MKAPLYNDILKLSQNIANASSKNDDISRLEACNDLQKLCATNQNSPKDHPLQWEALGDFTEDGDQAIDIYQIGLNTAEKMNLENFQASIYLSMAQRYKEFNELASALEYAETASRVAVNITSIELKSEINDFLASLKIQ